MTPGRCPQLLQMRVIWFPCQTHALKGHPYAPWSQANTLMWGVGMVINLSIARNSGIFDDNVNVPAKGTMIVDP